MKMDDLPSGLDVSHLNYINGAVLILSTVLFVFPIWEPAVDPYDILAVFGALVLGISFSITTVAYYRQLFTAEPQKISMLNHRGNKSRITISPYILDKRKIKVHVSWITFNCSPNYKILDVTLDGTPLNMTPPLKNDYRVQVDQVVTMASKFAINLEEKTIEINSRFLEFCLYYSKKKDSRFFKFKESHTIN